jgi:methionyl aminopeptidase
MKKESNISIKTPEELKVLRESGKILASIIQELKSSLKIGMTTKEVDAQAEKLMASYKVTPAFKGYRGYPSCICISLNEEVVHGIPGERIIREGDIVSLDVGIVYEKYYSDTAITVGMGRIKSEYQKLLDVTQEALYQGIRQAREGNHLYDISHAVQQYVENNHFSIVRDFVGHGIGRFLHEEPEIPNFGEAHTGPLLKEGMVFAIEPMVNFGNWQTKILEDGWTVVTIDKKPSAHFEHTIIVRKDEPEILTQ